MDVKPVKSLQWNRFAPHSSYMPSGKTHLRVEAGLLMACGGLAGVLLVYGTVEPPVAFAFGTAYLLSMVFLSPDLDLSRSRASRRWGVGRWLWLPYAKLFRHRRVSHHLLLGPLTRVLYLTGIALSIGFLYGVLSGRPIQVAAPSLRIAAAAWIGLYLPNLAHILTDRLHSAWRRRVRRRL